MSETTRNPLDDLGSNYAAAIASDPEGKLGADKRRFYSILYDLPDDYTEHGVYPYSHASIRRYFADLHDGLAVNWDGSAYDAVDWPHHEKELAELSKVCGGTTFTLTISEAGGDRNWIKVFKDGLVSTLTETRRMPRPWPVIVIVPA